MLVAYYTYAHLSSSVDVWGTLKNLVCRVTLIGFLYEAKKKTVNEAKLKFGYFDYIQGVPTSFGWKLFRRAYLKFARFQFVKKIVKLKGDPHSTMLSQKTNKFTIFFVFCKFRENFC